jgi:hypothetical protein
MSTMSQTSHLARLRAKYRSFWDEHQLIADQNARQRHAGNPPSDDQLMREQRAADSVRRARDELLATLGK